MPVADLMVTTVLLAVLGLWTVARLLLPEIRRGLPGTGRRLAVWALVVLLFAAVGAPGVPLPAIQVIDIVLWTLMGLVVLTVVSHHLRRGLRALAGRRAADAAAAPRARRERRMPTLLEFEFRLAPQGVTKPGDLLRWALITLGGFACLMLGSWIELPVLLFAGAMGLALGSVGLEISLAVQAWSIWQHRRRRASNQKTAGN